MSEELRSIRKFFLIKTLIKYKLVNKFLQQIHKLVLYDVIFCMVLYDGIFEKFHITYLLPLLCEHIWLVLFFSQKVFFKFQLFQYNIGFSLRQLKKFLYFFSPESRGKKFWGAIPQAAISRGNIFLSNYFSHENCMKYSVLYDFKENTLFILKILFLLISPINFTLPL